MIVSLSVVLSYHPKCLGLSLKIPSDSSLASLLPSGVFFESNIFHTIKNIFAFVFVLPPNILEKVPL